MTQQKQDPTRDRLLGMDQPITRRDFLNGIAIGAAAAANPLLAAALADPFTPLRMLPATIRRCSPACAAVTPAPSRTLMPCATAATGRRPSDTAEEYDLIVVGAGISGLAAAHFYRAHKPASRILILDNHDDFGGHAKRNEFLLERPVEFIERRNIGDR